jgi:uncharacterized protein
MHFLVFRGRVNRWYWSLYASNGEKIADSAEGYMNKDDCKHGIALVRSASMAPIRES